MSYLETINLINNRVTLFNDKEIAKTYKNIFVILQEKRSLAENLSTNELEV